MRVIPTAVEDVLVLEPRVFEDGRGFFFESFNARVFTEATGLDPEFVQDNHSRSSAGTLRGLHFQIQQPQAKLVRVVAGEILDVAVDIRRGSPSFGRAVTERLSAENRRQMWVPVGFAHGFCVLSDSAEVLYKATDFYAPEHERTLLWSDPELGIDWGLGGREPILSAKDRAGRPLEEIEVFGELANRSILGS